jgi:hypothetical protein
MGVNGLGELFGAPDSNPKKIGGKATTDVFDIK